MAKRQQPGMLFQETETEMPFPLEGVDVTRAFMKQRKMTCAAAANVRSFEPSTDRARGGVRHGLTRYFSGFAVPSGAPIQDIAHLTGSITTG